MSPTCRIPPEPLCSFAQISSALRDWKKKKTTERQKGNGSTAALTELRLVPGFYLTELIITIIVVMKAESSEAESNKSNSVRSGSTELQKQLVGPPRSVWCGFNNFNLPSSSATVGSLNLGPKYLFFSWFLTQISSLRMVSSHHE